MANEPCDKCSQVAQRAAPPVAPAPITNRPGLSTLAYRLGARASFLAAMKARLPTLTVEAVRLKADGTPETETLYPLTALTTRDSDDPAIALLDGWATAADVLTFYQERIAQEGYLRTAKQRRSILELARLVGYAPRPGVSASTFLAYTIDPLHVGPVEIPVGTRSQSVPGPGELPQTFETSDKLIAMAVWSELKPRLTKPQILDPDSDAPIYLRGTTTNLKPGDALLVKFGTGDPVLHYVAKVELLLNVLDPTKSTTKVILQSSTTGTTFPTRQAPLAALGAPLTREERISRFTQVIASHLNLDTFNLAGEGQMKDQVVAALQSLQHDLAAGPADEDIPGIVERALVTLREKQSTAAEKGYVRLSKWLNSLVPALERAAAPGGGEAALAAVAPLDEGDTRLPVIGANPQQVPLPNKLGWVVTSLLVPPSIPPRNSISLKRDLGTAFADGSDIGLQATGVSNPALPALLAKVFDRTPSQALPPQQVMALRVRARPHGHNAPKKQIKDSSGIVVGTVEWPLDGTQTLRVTLGLNEAAGGFAVSSANLAVTEPDGAVSEGVWSGQPLGLQLGGLKAEVKGKSVTSQDAVTVTFTDASGKQVCSLTFTMSDGSLLIADDAGAKRVIPPGVKVVQRVGVREFQMVFVAAGNPPYADVRLEIAFPPEANTDLLLDAPYDQIVPLSWVAVVRPNPDPEKAVIVAQVQKVDSVSTIDYDFPARVTQLTLDRSWLLPNDGLLSDIRNVTVYAQSEELELAEAPVTGDIGRDVHPPDSVELDGLYSGFESGRWMIVCGERADITDPSGNPIPGLHACERVMLLRARQTGQTSVAPEDLVTRSFDEQQNGSASNALDPTTIVPGDSSHTILQFAQPLAYRYLRNTVTIYGNVVKATNGETRNETLGGGDGSKPYQTFTLRQFPLTYVSADTPAGAASTLHVYVNDVEWHEAQRLADLGRADRSFLTSTGDDNKTSITFGDGEHGARLPTGAANVRAVYRNGIGKAGNVKAEQISLLMDRPLGVRGVVNPDAAIGGADRETRDEARRNVPVALLALDRLVSVQDYADFSRTFAGIGKAAAARVPGGRQQVLHVTIAGAEDAPIRKTSDLYQNLLAALRRYGDPDLSIELDMRELVIIVISARVQLLPDYLWEPVAAAIRQALLDKLSFEQREMAQPVYRSEVIGAIQAVPGVAYVDLEVFGGVSELVDDGSAQRTPDGINKAVRLVKQRGVEDAVPALEARPNTGVSAAKIMPAQLAILVPTLPETLILNQIAEG